MKMKNRYSFEKSRVPSSRKQTVGVDLRLVIIASLVVGMLLIQVILVETYSGKKPAQTQYFNNQIFAETLPSPLESEQLRPVESDQTSDSEMSLEEAETNLREIPGTGKKSERRTAAPSISATAAAANLPPRITLAPTRSIEHVDIGKLEEQLKELQDIQTDEDEELEGKEPPPPPLDASGAKLQEIPFLQVNITEDVGPDLTFVPAGAQAEQQQVPAPPVKDHHHHHHSSKSSSSSSSSVSTTSSSLSSSTSAHLSKSCRTRRHLFRSYKTPPRIVCFLSSVSNHHDKTDVLDPLWRQSFLHLGFQETQNPSLATFLVSKHSAEPKLKDYCTDSQVVNHVKSTRSLTNPVSLSKSAARHSIALKFHPETAVYGGFASSVSYSSKKTACAAFMSRSQDYLRAATTTSNTMIAAYVEKHDKVVAKLSMNGLRKMVDLYRKSSTCPHSDDTVVVQAFKNILLIENDRTLCSLRVFLYIPTTRPVMAFMSARAIVVRCSTIEKDTVDLFSAVASNETDFARLGNVKYYSLLEFRDKLLKENRFPNTVAASISFKELIQKLKRAIGGMVSAAKYKLELVPGRFGLLSADFVLDSFSLQPTLIKITDVPDISSVESHFPGAALVMLTEIIRSQQTLLKRTWLNVKDVLRPEGLRVLSDFELCGYDTLASKYLEVKDDASSGFATSGESFRVFPFA